MPITLHVEPRVVMSWSNFMAQKPRYSIALDGFVDGPPMRSAVGPYATYDHHAGVDRLATRATSEQVYMDIRMGLFRAFRMNGLPEANIWVNDPDEDTCLATWLLHHHEEVLRGHPAIERLVYCEGRLDATGGAFPLGDTSIRRKMAWIFEPYNLARFSGRIAVMQAAEMGTVIEAVGARITEHVFNGGLELALEGDYQRIGGGLGWALTKETGPASRMAMYNDGVEAFVAMVADKGDGSYVYSIGRTVEWIPFPLDKLYDLLNAAEPEGLITPTNRWGGSSIIGGSPRFTGSKLSPQRIQEIINQWLEQYV